MREMNEALVTTQNEAKKYAVEHEKTVFIYQSDFGWAFIEEEEGIRIGIQPTGGVISHHRPING